MSDKLFFGEVETQGNAAAAKYMASRGKHSSMIDNQAKDVEDLKDYNSVQSEEE